MKIAIDARLLSRQLTGIGRFTLEMCQALACQPGIFIYIYSSDYITPNLLNFTPTAVRTKSWENALLRHLWGETYLPYWILKDKVDVFWGTGHRLPLWLPKKVARVVTIHDLVWKYYPETMRLSTKILDSFYMPRAIRSADYITAVSQATANAIKSEFPSAANKIVIIPNAASKNISTKTSLIDQRYFLFVGTLEPRKNLSRLLQAYAELSDSTKNQAKLVIVGGKGWGNVQIEQMLHDLGLMTNVILFGYANEEQLATLYQHCLFLAMPSLYEGFGLPLIEAMSYGKPVLTADNSSMPEVADKAGCLVDALSVDAIRIGLEKMLNNESYRNTLAAEAKTSANRYSWDKSAQQLVNVFKKAIEKRAK